MVKVGGSRILLRGKQVLEVDPLCGGRYQLERNALDAKRRICDTDILRGGWYMLRDQWQRNK